MINLATVGITDKNVYTEQEFRSQFQGSILEIEIPVKA
jgi:hypothetical protein